MPVSPESPRNDAPPSASASEGASTTFRETRHASRELQVGVVLLGLVITSFIVATAVPDSRSTAEAVGFVLVALGSMALVLGAARMSSVVEVDPVRGVSLGFRLGIPVWRRAISRDEISEVADGTLSMAGAGGLGLRWIGPGRWALLVRGGSVIVIKVPDGSKEYLVGTDRPAELMAALRELGQG